MSEYQTVFASLKDYTKGSLEIVNDNPKYYVFSNVFDVASKSKPYEKVAVAVNVEYVIEAIRAEGVSTWFAAAHDEVVERGIGGDVGCGARRGGLGVGALGSGGLAEIGRAHV